MPTPQLPSEVLAMMRRGVSAIVASRDADLRPSLMRAMATRVGEDGAGITVYLARSQAGQVLQDIAANGHIAVVFSEPSTHRTVQVKATRVQVRQAGASDEAAVARYLASMERELAHVYIPAPLTRAMLACRLEDLVAVSFVPEYAFDQTPGPQAGTRLPGMRA
ncbi:pyridoxamine 5'-phosphate oxidase family protein [Caenimonas aquaedulcis]|uniref:Pyridoxamine 5'-phosphate oxidase family protein n=1 Tax=Caenimonas aquaedulcis TaxID=2793270 RepID=A0A931H6P7_9BURK|nr:pyridoxamine 5'-phosphate oxidase family protein [Caenimonas aquaedulcis]MBG9389437.1 pyridoxamine 5'-phosphate oxidase family protein [Caenimonas aquaedulcis]